MIAPFRDAPAQTPPNVSLNVTFIDEWAIYTLADWESNPDLFHIFIRNNSNEIVKYIFLEMQITLYGCPDPDIPTGEIGWGVTRGKEIMPYGQIIYKNDTEFNEGELMEDRFASEFQEAVVRTGSSLPAGTYTYNFRLLWNPNSRRNYHEAIQIASASQTVVMTMPAAPELLYPGDNTSEGQVILQQYPTFRWNSTGAKAGTPMYYRIKICEKQDNQSNDEAIGNLPLYEVTWDEVMTYYGSPWYLMESGFVFPIMFPYPGSAPSLVSGNSYVWQIYARSERNIRNASAGYNDQSEIFCFQFGESPENIIPPDGGEISVLQPILAWSSVIGAQGYKVRVTNNHGDPDPTVEMNFWEEDVHGNQMSRAPEGGILIPGNNYYWKVRALPDGRWSVPTGFTAIFDGEFSVQVNIPSVDPQLPQFSWTDLNRVNNYTLGIYTAQSPDALLTEITEIAAPFYNYTASDEPLQPNTTYFAKVDAYVNQQLVAVTEYEPFSFEPVDLGGREPPSLTITVPVEDPKHPQFSWSSVPDARQYEVFVNTTVNVSSNIWHGVSTSAEITYPDLAPELQNGNTYFAWVQPQNDTGEPLGAISRVEAFTIPEAASGGGEVLLEIIIGQ